ncbi:MAG: RNA polymerase subunit sigma-70, partial [Marinobacter sp.]
MKTSDHESPYELAGQYVLGTLPEAERRAVIERLKTDQELAELVAYWEERLVPLCDVVDPMPLPDSVWARISNSAQAEALAAAHDKQPQLPLLKTWWHNLPLWRGLTAAGFATALLLGVALSGQPQQPSYLVVLATPEGHSPGWVVQASNH